MSGRKTDVVAVNRKLREDAGHIIEKTLVAVNPEKAVKSVLSEHPFTGKVYLVAIGKAAYVMARAAKQFLGGKITDGVVLTKYGHVPGSIEGVRIIEAGHPLPDENSVAGAEAILDMTANLGKDDNVLFLISGGGSALFEKPETGVTLAYVEEITQKLLNCGADIVEINTVRKRLSAVKAGKFALWCAPARILSVTLSDVLGDRLDTVASGPAFPDDTVAEDALNVIDKYGLRLNSEIMKILTVPTPKRLDNVETVVIGNVSLLCDAAAKAAGELGYKPFVLSRTLNCEAREAGKFLASVAREARERGSFPMPCAIITGGETVVTVRGKGRGGRNQELALAAAEQIDGLSGVVIFSVGSDGTDGPTDAAGGIVDGGTKRALQNKNISISRALADNDSYNALQTIDGLIVTGPTGCNVNDFTVILCGDTF